MYQQEAVCSLLEEEVLEVVRIRLHFLCYCSHIAVVVLELDRIVNRIEPARRMVGSSLMVADTFVGFEVCRTCPDSRIMMSLVVLSKQRM